MPGPELTSNKPLAPCLTRSRQSKGVEIFNLVKLSVYTCSANFLVHLDICSFQYSSVTYHTSGVSFGAGDTVGHKKSLLSWVLSSREYRRQCGVPATEEMKQGDRVGQTEGVVG